MRKLLAIGSGLAVLSIGLAVFQGMASPQGQPKITWSAADISRTLAPLATTTTLVRFQSSSNITNVALWVNPSLADVVSVSPTSFRSIIANQNYEITLTFTAPLASEIKTYGGTIHLRTSDAPPRTYPPPLPINLRIQPPPRNILGDLSVDPRELTPNMPAIVMVSSTVSADASFAPTSITLSRVDANGKPIAELGTLRDDGTQGDLAPGDRRYTTRISFNEPTNTSVHIQASTVIAGQRFLSPITTLEITSVTRTSTGLIGPQGGTLKLSNGLTFSLPASIFNTPIPFTITSYLRNQLPHTISPALPIYGNIEISTDIEAAEAASNVTYKSLITVPLSQALPHGSRLTVIRYEQPGHALVNTGKIAIVNGDGKTATFTSDEIGLLLLVRQEDRGIENAP